MDYKNVLELFQNEDYELLDKEYKNTYQVLHYICNKHREKGVHEVTMNAFQRGKRCPYCKYEKGIFVNPLPEDIIKEKTEKRGYIYKGIERNQKTKVKFICPKHQEYGEQLKLWVDIRAGKQVCSRCNGHKSLKEFQEIVHSKSPNVDIIGDYDYCTRRLHCKCNVCGYEWSPLGYNLVSEKFTGCPECGKKRIGEKKSISYDYVMNKFSKVDKNIEILSIPKRTHEKVKCRCKICNEIWYPTFSNLTKKNNPTGCPFCKMSSGEREIYNFLKANKIKFEFQKTFTDCKIERCLPFDFYLSDYNLCIEYDGEFHFGDRNLDSNYDMEYIKMRDTFKTNYCKNHNINLIRIPYYEFKNIDVILNDYFFNKN